MATNKDTDGDEEIARLLATLIRLQTANQNEAILELRKSGFGASRIAELLGTSSGTVNVAIQRAKRSKKSTKAKKAKEAGK